MRYFARNVLRGMKKNRTIYIGAVLIIALGVFICVSMMETVFNLAKQVEEYYEDNKLGHVFATVITMPEEKLEKLKEIEGIAEVSGVLSKDVRLLSSDGIVSLHLMGYRDNFLNGYSGNEDCEQMST